MLRAALLALLALAVTAPSTAAYTRCGRIDIEYPNGKGGSSAVDIRATNIRCKPARRTVRACQRGRVRDGWKARLKGQRIVLTASRDRRITFLIAGGGGCGF
jgi:hypothetical protein